MDAFQHLNNVHYLRYFEVRGAVVGVEESVDAPFPPPVGAYYISRQLRLARHVVGGAPNFGRDANQVPQAGHFPSDADAADSNDGDARKRMHGRHAVS